MNTWSRYLGGGVLLPRLEYSHHHISQWVFLHTVSNLDSLVNLALARYWCDFIWLESCLLYLANSASVTQTICKSYVFTHPRATPLWKGSNTSQLLIYTWAKFSHAACVFLATHRESLIFVHTIVPRHLCELSYPCSSAVVCTWPVIATSKLGSTN